MEMIEQKMIDEFFELQNKGVKNKASNYTYGKSKYYQVKKYLTWTGKLSPDVNGVIVLYTQGNTPNEISKELKIPIKIVKDIIALTFAVKSRQLKDVNRIEELRAKGKTWEEIGKIFGCTRQCIHAKYTNYYRRNKENE